jgi:peptidoglycan/xylan/chitin deacetylase (PgdA/CDA1 family)
VKRVILTIDDGPSERCSELVDFLAARGIGAILFCRGDALRKREALAVKAIHAGFVIANHSWNHANFNSLSEREARRQIERADAEIERVYARASRARPAKWFRFPYGYAGKGKAKQRALQRILRELGYSNPFSTERIDWLWDADVRDWHVNEKNAKRKLETAVKRLKTLRDGGVLDLHDQEANLRTRLMQKTIEAALALGIRFHSNREVKLLTRAH